jgi:uncharacterized protein YggU (UPF0235/DUF167 family)
MPARFSIKVVPGSSRNRIVGWLGDTLKVAVRVAPEKGKANKAVEALLTEALQQPKHSIRIVAGYTAARKVIEVDELSSTELRHCLNKVIS